MFLSTYVEATLVCFGSFAWAWLLSPKRYSVSKPTTVPRHDAILPIGHEHMLLTVGCVCLWDKEDIVFFWVELVAGVGFEPHDLRIMSPTS